MEFINFKYEQMRSDLELTNKEMEKTKTENKMFKKFWIENCNTTISELQRSMEFINFKYEQMRSDLDNQQGNGKDKNRVQEILDRKLQPLYTTISELQRSMEFINFKYDKLT